MEPMESVLWSDVQQVAALKTAEPDRLRKMRPRNAAKTQQTEVQHWKIPIVCAKTQQTEVQLAAGGNEWESRCRALPERLGAASGGTRVVQQFTMEGDCGTAEKKR